MGGSGGRTCWLGDGRDRAAGIESAGNGQGNAPRPGLVAHHFLKEAGKFGDRVIIRAFLIGLMAPLPIPFLI